jgi:hypothetical protein
MERPKWITKLHLKSIVPELSVTIAEGFDEVVEATFSDGNIPVVIPVK